MKLIAHDSEFQTSGPIAMRIPGVSDRDSLLMEVVGWCIERYYHADRSEHID